MKRVIIFVICYALCIAAAVTFGQNFTVKSSSGFNTENAVKTSQHFVVDGKSFEVFQTKTGSLFVKGISAEGKTYPIWIGNATSMKFQNKEVRQFKSGSYAIFSLGINGFPKATYLAQN